MKKYFTQYLACITILVFLPVSIFSQTGLIAHYPLNGNANDAGPNGLHGNIVNNPQPTIDMLGNSNSAMMFDGIDDYIEIPYDSLLQPEDEVTLSLWAYFPDWSAINFTGAIAGNTESGGYELYEYFYNFPEMWGAVRRGGSYAYPSTGINNLDSGWHHFAITYDQQVATSLATLYIDGNKVDTKIHYAVADIDYSHQNSFLIGAEAGPQNVPEGDFWQGGIDEVRIYNYALSEGGILALYTNPTGSQKIVPEPTISIFPNPATENIRFSFAKDYILLETLSVLNMNGIEQFSVSINASMDYIDVDVSRWPAGIYIANISGQQTAQNMKIVIIK